MRSMLSSRLALPVLLLLLLAGRLDASPDSIYRHLGSHVDDIESVAASPNNTYFASGSWDKTICIFNNDSSTSLKQILFGHNAAVSALAFSRDGKNLVSGGKDYKVIVWKLNEETGEFEKSQEISMVHTAGINSVLYGPGMRSVYSAGDDGRIMIYDLIKSSSKIIENKIPVKSIALSTNKRFIYVADESPIVKQYDGLGNVVKQFEGHTDYVNTVAYSNDNKYLVTGGNDKDVIIWDLVTGRIKRTLKGHEWKVTSLSISADSKYVISGSSDGTVKIWDINSGALLKSLQTGGKAVRSVDFSADETVAIVGMHIIDSVDGMYGAFLWQTGVKRIMASGPSTPRPVSSGPTGANSTVTPNGSPNTNSTTSSSSPKTTKPASTNKKVVKKTDEVEVYIEEEPE